MKNAFLSIPLGTLGLVLAVSLFAQPRPISPAREFMRVKLDHAQSVLEGITFENFDLIRAHATKLGAMSEQASWRMVDTPEYVQQSLLFKRTADALSKAAGEHNLDAATLAYTKMTFSCVECHKYLRGRKIAQDGITSNQF